MTTPSWLLDERRVRFHDVSGGLSCERQARPGEKGVVALRRAGLQALIGLLGSHRDAVRLGLDLPGFGPIVLEIVPGNGRAKVRVLAPDDTEILRGELLDDDDQQGLRIGA